MDSLNFKTIYLRVKSETPVFWKKIRLFMVSCTGLGIGLTALKAEYTIEWMSPTVSQYLIVIGAVGAFLSSLTVKSNEVPSNTPDQP